MMFSAALAFAKPQSIRIEVERIGVKVALSLELGDGKFIVASREFQPLYDLLDSMRAALVQVQYEEELQRQVSEVPA